MPDATANLAASLIVALEVIACLDHIMTDVIGIDLDVDIPEWTQEQRAAITLARAHRKAGP